MAYTFDGPNKMINLSSGTTYFSVRDLWSRWVDWILTGDNSKYLFAFESVGGNIIDAGEGTFIPIYAFLANGWRIKPQEANHTLNVRDGILLVSGGGDPFVNTIGNYIVRINYQQPVQAISFATGGSVSAPTVEEIREEIDANSIKVNELHKLQGLKKGSPMMVTNTRRMVDDIELIVTEEGSNKVTVERL